MRICFVDFAPWDYNVATPLERPLGGSQSAMCYLAVELAKLGHEVATLTETTRPGRIAGVECANVASNVAAADAVIVVNSPGHGRSFRQWMPPSTRLVLWTQHDSNQPVMSRRLSTLEYRDAWDAIVCVSDWQRRKVEALGVDPARTVVLRNAIAPAFENLFASREDFLAAKDGDVLRHAYTSTPYRGLVLMPRIWPPYWAANPDARLEVYSSMAVHMQDAEEDRAKCGPLYEELRGLDGVDLIGSLPQPELAKRLRGAHILAYPNAFPETSCISVMEALAAGMQVITSDLGALPETCEGFAKLVPIDIDIDDASRAITIKDAKSYVAAYQRALAQPYTTAGLYQQAVHMNAHHTWAIRAREWADFLAR